MKQKIMIAVCALLLTPSAAMAQYPQLSGEGAARIDSMKKAWERHADEAWTKAFPIVQKEAQQGRPYVPWASRPYDLRQAKIPAFPGAEGGGMYTFGGRGGKVLVVTNLDDDGPVRSVGPANRAVPASWCSTWQASSG